MTPTAILLDATTVAVLATVFLGSTGLGAFVISVVKAPGERKDMTVTTAGKAVAALDALTDQLQEELMRVQSLLDACRKTRDAKDDQIRALEREKWRLEMELRTLRASRGGETEATGDGNP